MRVKSRLTGVGRKEANLFENHVGTEELTACGSGADEFIGLIKLIRLGFNPAIIVVSVYPDRFSQFHPDQGLHPDHRHHRHHRRHRHRHPFRHALPAKFRGLVHFAAPEQPWGFLIPVVHIPLFFLFPHQALLQFDISCSLSRDGRQIPSCVRGPWSLAELEDTSPLPIVSVDYIPCCEKVYCLSPGRPGYKKNDNYEPENISIIIKSCFSGQ